MEFRTTEWERNLRGLPSTINCDDKLKDAIDEMIFCSKEQDFECANEQLKVINEILETPLPDWSDYDPCREHGRTLLNIHDVLRQNSIRLDYKEMDLPKYLKLLEDVQIDVLAKGEKIARESAAEHMAKLELPPQTGRGRKAPNRAFMDILFKYNPQMAGNDLKRRESTKMWHAIKKEDEDEIKQIRESIREIRRRKNYE